MRFLYDSIFGRSLIQPQLCKKGSIYVTISLLWRLSVVGRNLRLISTLRVAIKPLEHFSRPKSVSNRPQEMGCKSSDMHSNSQLMGGHERWGNGLGWPFDTGQDNTGYAKRTVE